MTQDSPILTVFVLWHPGNPNGERIASLIFNELCGDPATPAVRGLGIAVRFITSTESQVLPPQIALGESQLGAVYILADHELVADASWRPYLDQLAQLAEEAPRLAIITLAETKTDYLPPSLAKLNAVRLEGRTGTDFDDATLIAVLRSLCVLLAPQAGKVQVFISHAKQDGLPIVDEIRAQVLEQGHLDAFFDATDIPDGGSFADVLLKAVEGSPVLLAVQTDAYGSREWCRLEVLEAKRRQVPIVVLSAIERSEIRSFPYMGNVPVVRWATDTGHASVLKALFREVLRSRYFPRKARWLSQRVGRKVDPDAFAYPPELLTALLYGARARDEGKPFTEYLYPDPPLGTEELQLIAQLNPELTPLTPTMLQAGIGRINDDKPSRVVSISVSESAPEELISRGLNLLHVKAAFIEFVRHLLAVGHSVAYGGDLRASGYTEALFGLIRTYTRASVPGPERVLWYTPWPVWMTLTAAERASLANIASIIQVPAPAGAPETLPAIAQPTPTERFWNSQSLTLMRQEMATHTQARIVVGGRTFGQQGLYPGVLEEAWLSLRSKVPLFLVGGFGGCGLVLAEMARGDSPDQASVAFQRRYTQGYDELLAAAEAAGVRPDFARITGDFGSAGFNGLNNGLDADENERLSQSSDVDELLTLILTGIERLG